MMMLVLRKCSVVFAVVWLLGTERGDFYAHGRALDGFCAAMGGDGERYVLLLVRSLSSGWCLLSVVESRLGPAGLFSRSCVLLFCSVQRCSALVSCCCHLFSSVQRPAVLFCIRPSCCSAQRRSPSSLFSRSCACTGNSASVLQSIHWSVRSHAV